MIHTAAKPRIKDSTAQAKSTEPELFWLGSAFSFLVLSYYTWRLCSVIQINYDVGLIALGADLICNGGQLYKEIHTVMFPGAYLILAGCFKLFGSTFFVCQLATSALIIAVGGLTLILSRKFIGGWLALLPATITVVVGTYMNPYFSHHWCSLFFFLVFANGLVLAVNQEKTVNGYAFSVIGLAGGLAILCYQTQLVPVILCSVVGGYLLAKKNGLKVSRTIVCLLAGVSTILGALLIGLFATETFSDFIDCTIKFVFSNYSDVNKVTYGWNNSQESIISLFGFPLNLCSNMIFGTLKQAPIIVILGSIIACIKEGSIPRAINKNPKVALLILLSFSLLFGEALHKPDLRRLVWGMPIMLIAVFYFAERVSEKYKSAKILIAGASIMLSAGLLFSGKMFLLGKTSFAKEYSTNKGLIQSTSNLEILEETKKLIEPGEKVLVYPYDTAVAYLAGGRHPSKYPILHYRYHTKEQFQSVIDDMESSKVRYVIWNKLFDNPNFSELGWPNYKQVPASELIMEPYLKSNYKPIKMYGNYLLMERK